MSSAMMRCGALLARRGGSVLPKSTVSATRSASILKADEGTRNYKLFKATNLVSMVAAPLALSNVGSDIMAFDYVLCASLPITFHIGANWVITDYVANYDEQLGKSARIAMIFLSLGAAAGLTKMCVKGDGIAAPIASLWTYKKPKEEN